MAAEHRNATVAAVRIAGQTADILRDLMAAVPTDDRVAVDILRDLTAARPMGDPVAVARIEAAVLLIADLAAVVVDIEAAVAAVLEAEAVAVLAEEAVLRAEEAAVRRMRPRHMVAVEGPIGKIVRAWLGLGLSQPSPSIHRL